MKEFLIKLKSESSLVFDCLKKDVQDELKQCKQAEVDPFWNENWWRKAHFDYNGGKTFEDNKSQDVFLKNEWFRGMLGESAKKCRIVPHDANSKKATYTNHIKNLLVESEKPICKVKDLKQIGRYDVNKMGQKIWNLFPNIDSWESEIVIIDTVSRILKSELKELMEYGGLCVGIGAKRYFRHGRFSVIDIKEIKK